MKLYATVTSERASKGQGGNEYIIIDLNVGQTQMVQLELLYHNDTKRLGMAEDEWVLQWRKGNSEDDNEWEIIAQGNVTPETKGKKQLPTPDCNENCTIVGGVCVKEGHTKGKKQKGEAEVRCKHGVLIQYDDCLNCDKGD